MEAEDFRDLVPEFQAAGAAVAGISKDTVESHRKFRDKHELNFVLLADPEKVTLEQYGVLKEKTMYGKKVMGTDRSTFLIGPEGTIRRIWRGVKVAGHARQVLEALQELVEKNG